MFCFAFLLLFTYASGNDKSALFTKTKITINKCDHTTNLGIFDKVKNNIACALLCSSDAECRRYLYCSSTSSCNLYLDGTDCIMTSDSIDCSCFKKNFDCDQTACTCPYGYYGERCQNIIEDCTDGYDIGIRGTNKVVSSIQPTGTSEPVHVLCLFDNGGSTFILNRQVECDTENFNRTMSDYKTGFGEVVFNSWIGLENIVRIQAAHSVEAVMEIYLLVDNFECKIEYRDVTIKDEMSGYAFTSTGAVAVSSFTFCGDALLSSISLLNQSFSTADIDSTGDYECAIKYGGGWWYKDHVDCTRGFLTGTMDGSGKDNFWFNANGINEVAVQLRFI